jgi:hypothetical protein
MKRFSIMARERHTTRDTELAQRDSHPEVIVRRRSLSRRQWPGDSEQMVVARQPETVTLIRPSANSTSAVPKYLTAVKRK